MSINTGLDFYIDALPVLGGAFDLFFKANNRNFALLRKELAARTIERETS